MAELRIDYPAEIYAAFQQASYTIESFLKKVLFSDDNVYTAAEEAICHQLLTYHQEIGGHPKVSDLDLFVLEFDAIYGKGKLKFSYDLIMEYSCSGLYSESSKGEAVAFIIDTNVNVLLLRFIDFSARSTADEF